MKASRDTAETRIRGKCHAISYDQTLTFFDARGSAASDNPLTATMYQDAELAARRDEAEKQTVLPLLAPGAEDRVLDLGCGSGRWAKVLAAQVAAYLGIDFSKKLLEIARSRVQRGFFQQMNISALDPAAFQVAPPFNLIICSGVLAYINDADMPQLFEKISDIAGLKSRIYIREPIAKAERLTLDGYWSDELQSSYSAIYRTRTDYLKSFEMLAGFELRREMEPFPPELQNRVETQQYCFLLER